MGRFVPFAVDVATHVLAFVALSFLRMPAREPAAPATQAVLICAAGMAVVTLLVTPSRSLRGFARTEATEAPIAAEASITDEESVTKPEGDRAMDDDARYEVLRNDEDQYSLWLAGQEVPQGWYRVGKEGTKEECSAYVDEVWTDMRPRSLRERMDGASQS